MEISENRIREIINEVLLNRKTSELQIGFDLGLGHNHDGINSRIRGLFRGDYSGETRNDLRIEAGFTQIAITGAGSYSSATVSFTKAFTAMLIVSTPRYDSSKCDNITVAYMNDSTKWRLKVNTFVADTTVDIDWIAIGYNS